MLFKISDFVVGAWDARVEHLGVEGLGLRVTRS